MIYLVGARPGEIPFGTRFAFAAGEREHRVELALSDPIADASGAARGGASRSASSAAAPTCA